MGFKTYIAGLLCGAGLLVGADVYTRTHQTVFEYDRGADKPKVMMVHMPHRMSRVYVEDAQRKGFFLPLRKYEDKLEREKGKDAAYNEATDIENLSGLKMHGVKGFVRKFAF